jgi:raffinose/stachyose/melibiose transport system substrate-binding protein
VLGRKPFRSYLRDSAALFGLVGLIVPAGCAGGAQSSGPVVEITCATCQDSPTDPFLQSHYQVVQQFNSKYKGQYSVKVVQNPYVQPSADRLQYFERLALANNLPDVFVLQRSEIQSLAKTGKLYDLTSALAGDATWKKAFYPGAFDAVTIGGKLLAIPEERDSIGIFYNKALFAKANINQFPTTWDEFQQDCAALKAAGTTCFAMDGLWVTLLMWSNLIGTQSGGADFLSSGITKGNFGSNSGVVKATEFLKKLHTSGYVNRDAFTGDYKNAATPFVQGSAAMIANGPWMVPSDIKGKTAPADLYSHVGYETSPGWTSDGRGLIIVAGNGGWVSGSRDSAKQKAVIAFMRFLTSPDIALQQTVKTGAYPAVNLNLQPAQLESLDPLALHLVQQSNKVPFTYEHAFFATPAGFFQAWTNNWPAYVQGAMSTNDFLAKLSTAVSQAN